MHPIKNQQRKKRSIYLLTKKTGWLLSKYNIIVQSVAFNYCIENINYEVILKELKNKLRIIKFCKILFCKQITDKDEETKLTEAHQSFNSLEIDHLQIFDQTEQNVEREEVYELLISLKQCKMTKLVLNGMNYKVVGSLLGNTLKRSIILISF